MTDPRMFGLKLSTMALYPGAPVEIKIATTVTH